MKKNAIGNFVCSVYIVRITKLFKYVITYEELWRF